jgi:hypothetical protein
MEHQMGELEQVEGGWKAACSCGWATGVLVDAGEVRYAWEEHSGQEVNG